MSDESSTATVVTSENLQSFNHSRLGIEPVAVPAAAVAEPVVEVAEPAAEVVEESKAEAKSDPDIEDDADGDKEDKGGKKDKLQERFSKITRDREEARREAVRQSERADAAEQKLRDAETKLNPKNEADVSVRPAPGDFTDAFEYAEKLAEWSTQQALAKRDKEEGERSAATEKAKVVAAWNGRQAAFRAETPDYDDMLSSSDVKVSDQVRDAILESDVGPQILHHLASNPELADALNAKSAGAALRQIGRLEAQFEAKPAPVAKAVAEVPKPAPARISAAPAPITPVKGGAISADDMIDGSGVFTGTYQQFKALSAAGKIR